MKFYIASGVENAKSVAELATLLIQNGHTHTYDWTKNLRHTNDEFELSIIAEKEVNGVKEAEILIVILPGGRGTHTEIGVALAEGIPVIIYAARSDAFVLNGQTNPFYYHRKVRMFSGGDFIQFKRRLIEEMHIESELIKACPSWFGKKKKE